MNRLPFDAQMARLRDRLAGPLPGTAAQFEMAPAYRRDASVADVRDKPCREAGVLALLFPLGVTPGVLLTVRRDDLNQHAGQVSFPGGRREPGETLQQTALREAEEEVGLRAAGIDVLGALTPLYIPPSNFCVYPFVAAVPAFPALYPRDGEVARIVTAALTALRAPETRRRETWTLQGTRVEVPFFAVEGLKVWGATAMMLAELLALTD